MSLLHYIDNEVPSFGEWDSVVQNGSSTLVQSAAAAFPERGQVGLRATISGAGTAYVRLDDVAVLAAGEGVYVGFWMYMAAWPSDSTYILTLDGSGIGPTLRLQITADGNLRIEVIDDGGSAHAGADSHAIPIQRWTYVTVCLVRATGLTAGDGYGQAYIDGAAASSKTSIDNYDRAATAQTLQLGVTGSARDGFVLDFDETKVAASYPEPFVPAPADEYLSAARMVVLFRQGDSDSREFADYCVGQLGIPRSNLCPLPNASGDESLADYATFQSEVENDLAAWLALNPAVADNCSCFLIGFGVPGYFTHGGVKHSATSRLMNYGTAFSSQMDNPLYSPTMVARLTKTALGGKYLCTRIDADSLAGAKAIIDYSATVSALSALPATDKLHSDNAEYRASLACQHLRIIAEGLPAEYGGNDAFIFGDTGSPSFKGDGTRAAFVDDSEDSASSLRTGSAACRLALSNSYAAALGSSEMADTFDAVSFFEMLRIGGTLAEAFAVAIKYLNYMAVPAGSPLMTVAFAKGGYNVYRGTGGIEDIDWDDPAAYVRPGQESITFSQDLPPGQRYVYAARAVSTAGIEEHNTHVVTYVESDAEGNLLPAPLARPTDLTVEVQEGGDLLIGFSYQPPVGFAAAEEFDVLGDNGTGQLDLNNPVATVEKSCEDQFDFELSITKPETSLLLAVRAREGERPGPPGKTVFVPLQAPPAEAQIL